MSCRWVPFNRTLKNIYIIWLIKFYTEGTETGKVWGEVSETHFYTFLLPRQEKSRWEVLQQEQRLMEEKNKRKKALLAKAIAER